MNEPAKSKTAESKATGNRTISLSVTVVTQIPGCLRVAREPFRFWQLAVLKETDDMSWQRISGLIVCLLLLSATACGQGPDDNPDGTKSSATPSSAYDRPLSGSVVINDVDRDIALRESDAYELETDGEHRPVIENDTLTLTVSYSGGCETHDFTLVTDGSFMESYPVQLLVTLTHDANDDPCEAYPRDSYAFDLTPLKALYQEAYRTDEGSIVLHLRHSGEPGVLMLVYAFAP